MKKEYVEEINVAAKKIFEIANRRCKNRVRTIDFHYFRGEQSIGVYVYPGTIQDIVDLYGGDVAESESSGYTTRALVIDGITYIEVENQHDRTNRMMFEEGKTFDELMEKKEGVENV